MFKASDEPINEATAIFDMLTGIARTLHIRRITKIAINGISNELKIISLDGFIFHPSSINPRNIERTVKITEYLNFAAPDDVIPLTNSELLFQLKRILDTRHKM
ncbi:MAG: hypothetical protein QW120_06540 [Nitrososphaerota archaeon]